MKATIGQRKEQEALISVRAIVADIYCRVSSDDQEDNTSLDLQEREGREYCAAHGLIVGLVHKEVYSGYKYRERKKLALMRERCRDKKIGGVVFRTLDRLSRQQSHVAILLEEMEHYGVAVHCIKEVIDETVQGKFARMILAFVAEMEREKILDRTMSGRVERAKEGKVSVLVAGNKPRYGWKWHDPATKDYLVHDEEAVKLIKRLVSEFVNGVPVMQMIVGLEEEGVSPPRSGKWYTSTILRILKDPRIAGKSVDVFTDKRRKSKTPLPPVPMPEGTYPAIIDEETYEKILMRMKSNRMWSHRKAAEPEAYLLRAGFALCSLCGWSLTGKIEQKPGGYKYHKYFCPNSHCDARGKGVSAPELDDIVWSCIEPIADHAELMERSVALALSKHTSADDLKAVDESLATWRAKIANFEADLEDVGLRGEARAAIRNHLNAAYEMVEKLEKDRADLVSYTVDVERQRAEFEKILDWCKRVTCERTELTYLQKRDFLLLLGAKVVVTRELTYGRSFTWEIRVSLPEVYDIIYGAAPLVSASMDVKGSMQNARQIGCFGRKRFCSPARLRRPGCSAHRVGGP